MPLPFIIGGIAVAAGAYGAKKGYDASEKNEQAERIVRKAEDRFYDAKKELTDKQEVTNQILEDFGELKLNIFTGEIKRLIDIIKKCKSAKSKYEHKEYLTKNELKDLEIAVDNSLDISSGLASGAAAGVLTSMGAYGAVGALATASTGTAISTLSGVAATNATLAWLGGGSLAAGGGGMALGSAVIGGIVAGPLIAVTGMFMDSKADDNLDDAKDYRREVNSEISKMELLSVNLDAIQNRVEELENILYEVREYFNDVEAKLDNMKDEKATGNDFFSRIGLRDKKPMFCNSNDFEKFLIFGKQLKSLLDISILEEDGTANSNLSENIIEIMENK